VKNTSTPNALFPRSTGQLIRYHRELAQLSQEQLGAMVGCGWWMIDVWERGQQVPGLAELWMLAHALHVHANKLVREG
jgi:DNA-binding transcriptional regulator YiaG